MGLILFELCVPMKTVMERNLLFRRLSKERTFGDKLPMNDCPESELILRMTELDPHDRPSSSEVVS